MEGFLRKYTWALNLALIGLGTLLTALLINGFVAVRLAPLTVPHLPSFQVPDAQVDAGAGGDRERWADSLKARCLFGCPEEVDPTVCPGGCPEGEVCDMGTCVPVTEEYVEEPYSDIPVATELPLKLKGSMVAVNPRWSMAMILDEGGRRTHVAGVGDILPMDAEVEVLEIRRDRVFISHNGRMEYIRMEDAPTGAPQARTPARPPSGARATQQNRQAQQERPTRSTRESAQERAVVEEGENQFTVDRASIERHLADPAALTRQARIMPNYRDGEPNGLRLVGVTPNSLYSDLGIRSGDVIHSINGRPVTNQREAMELLERMGQGGDVNIEVERRGRMQQMQYNVR